jgi:hypothetical protein
VLEWVWFLNAFGDKHVYEFMYGDKAGSVYGGWGVSVCAIEGDGVLRV